MTALSRSLHKWIQGWGPTFGGILFLANPFKSHHCRLSASYLGSLNFYCYNPLGHTAASSPLTAIGRLNLVKNTNFWWDNKKMFLTHWKCDFRVTDHFCIKWTFWKIAFFCPKNAFFWQKWQYIPLFTLLHLCCQGTFFSYCIFLLKFWRICFRKV